MTVLYTGVNLYRLDHFYPLDFDLAIFGQGIWLLSRGDVPFVTIRGLNLFGEHATWIHLPVALLFAVLGPLADARALVLLQSGALALAGLFLYRIAGREVGASAAILVLLSYLLHPALQHTWLEYYEPVNLAVPCLVAATQAVREGRDRPALLWSLLALSTMENVAATVLALGGYAWATGRRRLGLRLLGVASVYLLVIMRVTFPWLSEHGYVFADRLYGDFARSLPEAVAYLARPDHLLGRLATPANGHCLLGLLVPVAFLPLAAPATLVVAAQLPLNLVSSWPYAHDIRYHYVAPIIPFLLLSLIRALARFPAGSWWRRGAVGALAIGLGLGQVLYGSAWIVPREGQRLWRGLAEDAKERVEVLALLARLPPEASVSAHYRFLPALCRRSRLFMFPDTGPEGTWPDALLVDETRLDPASRDAATLRRGRVEAVIARWPGRPAAPCSGFAAAGTDRRRSRTPDAALPPSRDRVGLTQPRPGNNVGHVDRRTWLTQATLAAGALVVGPRGEPSPAASAPTPSRLHLGIVTYNVARDWDLETILKNVREAGLEGVEFRTTHAHGVEPGLDAARRREVRDRCKDAGLLQTSLGSVCEFQSPDPAVVKQNIETCREFVLLARDIGARAVKVRPNGLPEGVPVEKTLEQIGKALAECGRFAADAGVEIWMEVHGKGTQEPPHSRRIMEHCGHPGVGVTWNSNPTDVANGSVRDAFARLGRYVRCCHITELWGAYPYRELFSLLAASGYERFTLCEIPQSLRPEDGATFLKCYRALWHELQR